MWVSDIKAHLVNYFNLSSENIGKIKQNFLKLSSSLSKSSKVENEKTDTRNRAILAEFETCYDDVSQFSENEYECESKSRTRKSSLGEKSIENNSFNLLESYLKPSNAYPNSDTITSSHDNINTDKQNIDIITASNNNNNLTINEPTINQNLNTNSKHNFNLIPNNELVDNNINQPVVAPNPKSLDQKRSKKVLKDKTKVIHKIS